MYYLMQLYPIIDLIALMCKFLWIGDIFVVDAVTLEKFVNSSTVRHNLKFKAIICSAIIASGASLLGPLPAYARNFMSQKELLATLPGSQISGVSNRDGKTPWVQADSKANGSKKGLISGIWNKKDKYQSEWYVKGDQWCEKWDGGEGCWQVERESAKKLRAYKDGKPLKNTWTLK